VVVIRITFGLPRVKADAVQWAEGSSPECDRQTEKSGHGECSGYYRGLRPGHVFTGTAWELGRAIRFLVNKPVRASVSQRGGVLAAEGVAHT
jgi:hypothetical protein